MAYDELIRSVLEDADDAQEAWILATWQDMLQILDEPQIEEGTDQ